MTNYSMGDLVVLCADKYCKCAVNGLLSRTVALGIRQIKFDIFTHMEHDPGCSKRAYDFLLSSINHYAHALVIFDREGCGQETKTREELEDEVQQKLSQSGWNDRSDVIVIDPELEIWVWSDSSQVDECLGWKGKEPGVRDWIKQNKKEFWPEGYEKPLRPKEAMEAALRQAKKPKKSASYFKELGDKVSVNRCIDPAFKKLKDKLQEWFPQE